MKRLLFFITALMILLLCSSCSYNDRSLQYPTVTSQYSTSNSFVFGTDTILTIDTPSSGSSKFFVISSHTNSVFPLCFDPVCNHISDDCPSLRISGNTLFNYTCDSQYMYYAYNPQSESNFSSTKIIRIDLSTAKRKELLTLDNRIFGLKYDSGYLYFIDNYSDTYNRISRIDLNTSELSTVLDGANTNDFYDLFCIKDNKIYFLRNEHDGLFEYNIETNTTRCVVNTYTNDIFLNEDRIFLFCRTADQNCTKIYNIKTDATSDLIIDNCNIYGVMDVAGDILYFTMAEKIPYSMPSDAKLVEILGDEAERALADRYYYNTVVYSYNLSSGVKKEIGSYDMHTINTLQIFNNTLYVKGSKAIDLGNGYIATENSGKMKLVENHEMIKQYGVERSNLDVISEVYMVSRINASIIATSSLMKAIDQMYQQAISLNE